MRIKIPGFFVIFFVTWPSFLFAQSFSTETALSAIKTSQHNVLHAIINSGSRDANIDRRLTQFVRHEMDSIQNVIRKDKSLKDADKQKAYFSLAHFAENLKESRKGKNTDLYDIPGAIESYKILFNALVKHRPYSSIIEPLGPTRTQLLANSFQQFAEYQRLNDLAVYKRVVSSPEHILRFLETRPNFRFADSLLLYQAATDPVKLALYLKFSNSGYASMIRFKGDPYLRQLVVLSDHLHASELLPFIAPLTEKRITVDEILQKRLDVNGYFQLLVNTLIEYNGRVGINVSGFHNALRKGIKEKSLSFYVDRINEQHNEADDIRFTPIKDLRPEDLYYIITSSGEELYTSSYLGLFRRLMEFCRKQSTDSLFRIVHYDNYRPFVRIAANYNTLNDFFTCLPKETSKDLVTKYAYGIEEVTETGLEKAMDVADTFTELATDLEYGPLLQNILQSNFNRSLASNQAFGTRIYSILLRVFDLVSSEAMEDELRASLGRYEKLPRRFLVNKNGDVVEMVLFYGDEDGISSFKNFLTLFNDAKEWTVEESELWVTIRSVKKGLIIYANRPLDNETELDIKAQEALSNHLRQQSIEPVILIHRGHSYHLPYTLKRLNGSVKLAILGSCGGYNNILSVANLSPDAQIIVSKKIGTMVINDPLIDVINHTITDNKDLVWSEIWDQMDKKFSKDAFAKNLFSEYIPPTRNISLFVLKLFNLHEKEAK